MSVQDDIERKLANQDMTMKAKLEEILQKDQKIASLENEVKNMQKVITNRDLLRHLPVVQRPQPTVFGIGYAPHHAPTPQYGYPNWWYPPPLYYSPRHTYHHH